VEYKRPESDGEGFWNKAGEALKKVGHVVKDALPYVSKAAEALGNSPSAYLPDDDSLLPIDTGLVLTSRSERTSRQRYLNAVPINKYSSKPLANNRRSQLALPSLPTASPKPDWHQLQARTARTLNTLAKAKGLPSYEEFHRQQGVPFQNHARQGQLGIQRFNPSPVSRRGFIPEDERQIRSDLAQGQEPRSLADPMARQQAELIAQQQEDARQAALYEQRQWQRAQQKARELRLQSQASTRQSQVLQAQTVNRTLYWNWAFRIPRTLNNRC
jgi:hypothetical protein